MLGIAPLNRLEPRGCTVRRAVVDKDQLVAQRLRPQHSVELSVQRLDVVDFVENRDEDGEIDGHDAFLCLAQEQE